LEDHILQLPQPCLVHLRLAVEGPYQGMNQVLCPLLLLPLLLLLLP
jgi:hypothetical protein